MDAVTRWQRELAEVEVKIALARAEHDGEWLTWLYEVQAFVSERLYDARKKLIQSATKEELTGPLAEAAQRAVLEDDGEPD